MGSFYYLFRLTCTRPVREMEQYVDRLYDIKNGPNCWRACVGGCTMVECRMKRCTESALIDSMHLFIFGSAACSKSQCPQSLSACKSHQQQGYHKIDRVISPHLAAHRIAFAYILSRSLFSCSLHV